MGPGVVSMSFGAGEGSWTTSVDATFAHAGMTYLAATGDAGTEVCWPAVSTNVVAVGGTSLTYSGTAARAEAAWSGTGGGISQYVATPSYQTNAVPGIGALAHRAVPDVAFNADPGTGQYVAISPSGSTSVSWMSIGGTSLSTPQWAGLTAVANAVRAASGKAALGAPHSLLYGQIGAVPGTYASAFLDVTTGSDGSCSTCSAQVGYDAVTGLGTPNATALLAVLTGTGASAPVVSAGAVAGKVGTALSYAVSVSSPDAVTYTLGRCAVGTDDRCDRCAELASAGSRQLRGHGRGQGQQDGTERPGCRQRDDRRGGHCTGGERRGSGRQVGTALSYAVSVSSPDAWRTRSAARRRD